MKLFFMIFNQGVTIQQLTDVNDKFSGFYMSLKINVYKLHNFDI